MQAGIVAEYATPLELFDRADSIFHDMCAKANINREDIVIASAKVHQHQQH